MLSIKLQALLAVSHPTLAQRKHLKQQSSNVTLETCHICVSARAALVKPTTQFPEFSLSNTNKRCERMLADVTTTGAE